LIVIPSPPPRRLKVGALLLLSCAVSYAYADDADDEDDPNKASFLCVAEQAIYHSNLFHLNNTVTDVQQRLGPGANRYNTSMRTSACAQYAWQSAPQEFRLRADIDDNRFLNNKILNHTSGNAELLWNWETGGGFHGQLGGNYQRALGTFINDRPLVKDVVSSYRYFFEVNRDFGAHVIARVRGERTDTTHDAESRRIDNYRNTTGIGEVILMSRAENYLGFSIQQVEATYPDTLVVNNFVLDRNYRERTETTRGHYQIGSKTVIGGSFSHVEHKYQTDTSQNYSGYTWHASIDWQPRGSIEFLAAAWKDLMSYFDLEADHFISRGGSLTPKWMPYEKLTISLPLRYEKQHYIFRSVETTSFQPREDEVKIASVDVLYRPRPSLTFDLNYGYEHRDSTLPLYAYLDEMTSLQIRWSF